MRTLWAAMSALAIGLLVSSAARADRACQAVFRESIVTTYLLGKECKSPVGICTTGTVGPGPLEGTSEFTALEMRQHGTDILYSGRLVIHPKSGGAVTLRDAGVLNATTGSFFEIEYVIAGTGSFEGARGVLTSRGSATGTGFKGTLTGRVCTSDDDRSRGEGDFDGEDSDE
jgi:hypothetical protein